MFDMTVNDNQQLQTHTIGDFKFEFNGRNSTFRLIHLPSNTEGNWAVYHGLASIELPDGDVYIAVSAFYDGSLKCEIPYKVTQVQGDRIQS